MEEPTVSLSVPVIPPSLIDEELKTEALTSISQTELEKPFVRLPKAQKKLLKAEKLKARMKFQSKEYLKRRKERRLEALAANPELNNQVKATKALIEGSFERLSNALTNGLKVCVDLSFEEIQDDRELSSLAKQLAVAYGFLKKQQKPVHLHVCGLVPSSSIYSKLQQQGFESWIISRHSELPWDIYPKSKIVIMSPDASEPLETVESDKVYVIGGIVDRSVKKSQTLLKATELGIITRRLPIQEFIPNRQSHVLNVDHMIEILNRIQENQSWEEVLKAIVPLRKQKNQSKKGEIETVEETKVDDEITKDA